MNNVQNVNSTQTNGEKRGKKNLIKTNKNEKYLNIVRGA